MGEQAEERAGKSVAVVAEGGCLGAVLVEAVRLEVLGGRGRRRGGGRRGG